MKLFLASGSPRRAEVLRNAGIPFEVRAAEVDEAPLSGESAEALVLRLAETKARAASAGAPPGDAIVIGADTTVEVAEEILGKPASAEDARRMLHRLSGRTHRVLTGVFLLRLRDGASRAGVEVSAVRFLPLGEPEIEEYIRTGEPFDKAGAYAIQGRAGRFVERVEGCYFNIVGLPLARLCRMLAELGWKADGPKQGKAASG